MLRTIVALLAALSVGPLACDDGYPGDDADDTTSEGTTGDEESTGEAIEPTPIPFQPPLRKECTRGDKSARVRDCDP